MIFTSDLAGTFRNAQNHDLKISKNKFIIKIGL